jgi:hypothetical protein
VPLAAVDPERKKQHVCEIQSTTLHLWPVIFMANYSGIFLGDFP